MRILQLQSRGIPFTAVLQTDGGEPIVNFYDARFPFTEYGQFTGGSYYASTLLEKSDGGLILHGGVPDWRLDYQATAEMLAWLSDCLQTDAENATMR